MKSPGGNVGRLDGQWHPHSPKRSGLESQPTLTVNDWLGTGENTNSGIWAPARRSSGTSPGLPPLSTIPVRARFPASASWLAALHLRRRLPPYRRVATMRPRRLPYAGNSQTSITGLGLHSQTMLATCRAGDILIPPAYGTRGMRPEAFSSGRTTTTSISRSPSSGRSRNAIARNSVPSSLTSSTTPISRSLHGTDPTKPSTFGHAVSTPDSANPVLGSGGPRHIQFGLKLTF